MWFLNDSDGNRVIWLRPNQEFIIGKRNKNLKITDPSMSRTHAVLTICGTSVIVKDSNSTHGTWVKKTNSDFKREKQISLEHNDQVRFGLLSVYTVVQVQMVVSFSSVSSHDMIKLNQLSAKYDLVLKKDLKDESICLICGGSVFSAKKALALVRQIPVVSLEWLHGWDNIDPYSFEIPDFEQYLPPAFQVKNEMLEKELWKCNSKRKTMFKGLEFICVGDKQNLEMTKNVISAAGGTVSINDTITKSNVSNIGSGVILVCESELIDWIDMKRLHIIAITQDDLGIAIMKGVLDLDHQIRHKRSLISKASLRNVASSIDLFDDPSLSVNSPKTAENSNVKLQVPPAQQNHAVTRNMENISPSAKAIDVFNLFDDDIKNQDVVPSKVTASRKIVAMDENKPKEKSEDVFDLFNDNLLGNDSKKGQESEELVVSDNKATVPKSELKASRRGHSLAQVSSIQPNQNSTISKKQPTKKIDLDSFFDSLLNVDDDLQSQDPAVRHNSIEDSIKQKDSVDSPLKIVKTEQIAPIGTLKGKTTSLAERLGFQPLQKEEVIPSSLPHASTYVAEPFLSEGLEMVDIVVPATPVKPPTATVPKQSIHKRPINQEKKPLQSSASSSIRNQELISKALERDRENNQKTEDVEMVDSSRSYCRIIYSDSLIVKKPNDISVTIPKGSGINTKRFVSNQVRRLGILTDKPQPIKMAPYRSNTAKDDIIGKKQSRIRNNKKRNWPGFSSDEEMV